MARRKSTEVLITGDKVDPRTPVGATVSSAGPPKAKKPVGAFPEDNLARRPRKKPKVIDLVDDKTTKPSAKDALAELERELGMQPTAAPGEAAIASMSVPREEPEKENADWQEIRRAKKAELDLLQQEARPKRSDADDDWQKIERAKRPEFDLPKQDDPAPKSGQGIDSELSRPIEPKPQSDIAPAQQVSPKTAPAKDDAAAKPAVDKSVTPAAVKVKKASASNIKAQSNAIAETVVSSILDRIKSEAKKNGGQLSLANIEELQAEFSAQTQVLSLAFEQSFEAYVQARERAAWENKRDFPFDRLIVKKFSHLFGDRSAGFDRVSRRMLPGFFMAMGMMLGPDVVDDLQEKCRVIVERIRDVEGDDFDWSDVYEADHKAEIVLDALVPIALHFEDFEKRREWFITLVNGHLSGNSDDDKNDAGWELTVPGFNLFLNALLGDLRLLLTDPKEKPRIVKRYGVPDVNIVIRILQTIKPS